MGKGMNPKVWIPLAIMTLGALQPVHASVPVRDSHPEIELSPGFLTKIRCEGRLLVSAVGNESLIELQALPKELGCGVLLKPNARSGKTNLFLETSTGTISRLVKILEPSVTQVVPAHANRFEIELKAEGRE